jgi:hypothetical protein
MAGKITEWIMRNEEEYIVDGYVPNEMRMVKMSLAFDIMAQTAHVTGLMPEKGPVELVSLKANLIW